MIETIYSNPDFLMHYGVKGMQWGVRKDEGPVPTGTRHALDRRLRNYIGKKTGHYERNDKNVNLPQNAREAKKMGWEKSSKGASSAHQFYRKDGVSNQKWMSPDGHREVIFSGKGKNQKINNHQEDFGTYNKYNYKTNPIGHTIVDVLPYIALGNGVDDNTTMFQRVGTMSGNAIKNGAKKLKTMGVKTDSLSPATKEKLYSHIEKLSKGRKENRDGFNDWAQEAVATYGLSPASINDISYDTYVKRGNYKK